MRVGIDARVLERRAEIRGMGVLVAQLVRHLPEDDVDLVLFYSRPPDETPRPGRVKDVVLPLFRGRPAETGRKPSRLLAIIWDQLLLPLALRREPLDLFHAPANRGVPLLGRGRFIGTINDVIPLVTPYFFDSRPDPGLVTWPLRWLYWTMLAVITIRSRRVITLSECSRRDLERLFPWARHKIRVIHPGADPRYQRVEEAGRVRHVLTRLGLPPSFFIYVGGLGQRKNVSGLLRAYAILDRQGVEAPPLVVVGASNAFSPSLRALAGELGIAHRVHFTGFIADEEMPGLLSAAVALIYPSVYEGFGLPVLEAMACGCPVVCSKTSALPEIGGEAVLYCDPARPEDIAEKMEQVLKDGTLRARLGEAGICRARHFTVRQMVEDTVAVYREALTS